MNYNNVRNFEEKFTGFVKVFGPLMTTCSVCKQKIEAGEKIALLQADFTLEEKQALQWMIYEMGETFEEQCQAYWRGELRKRQEDLWDALLKIFSTCHASCYEKEFGT
jgi:hypothetical protein